MFLYVVYVLVALIGAFLAYALTRPPELEVSRSLVVPGAPSAAYGLVADFHGWTQWSPWEGLDPAMTRSYGGSESGTGAVYEWKGNNKVGQGRMTILSADPNARIDIKLEFLAPWQATNKTVFTFQPAAGGTEVTWAMSGRKDGVMMKVFSVLMNMEKTIGNDFERGLGKLRDAVASKS